MCCFCLFVVGSARPTALCSKTVRRTASNGAGGGSLLTMPGLTAFNATHEAERRQQLEVSKPSLSLLPLCGVRARSRRRGGGVALVCNFLNMYFLLLLCAGWRSSPRVSLWLVVIRVGTLLGGLPDGVRCACATVVLWPCYQGDFPAVICV